MDQSLRDAAEQGSIDALYALIQSDANVLDSMDKIPFVDTPLHIAASLGHTHFAMEIMKLKPSFARKLNQDGFSPMHLALQKHHDSQNDDDLQTNLTILVHRLLDVDKDLVRVQGREGVTPLHYVAHIGNLKFLKKFSKVCPVSFEDVTIRRETALHIALKSDKVEAFELLQKRLRQAWFKDAKLLEEKVLRWEDEEGNTLLHVAVSKNQHKVVSWLLDSGSVNLKAKNLKGRTVFDILKHQKEMAERQIQTQTETQVDNQRRMTRIREMLKRQQRRDSLFPAGLPITNLIRTIVDFFISPKSGAKKCHVGIRRQQTALTDEMRNELLVVAALLITVIYPLPFSRDEQPNQFNYWTAPINATDRANDNYHFNSTAGFNATIGDVNNLYQDNHNIFLYGINTLTYYLTNITLFFLLPPGLIGWVLYALLAILFLSYLLSSFPLSISNSSPLAYVMVSELLFVPLSTVLPWLAAFTDKPVNDFSSSILE